jgi:hypothetical protein
MKNASIEHSYDFSAKIEEHYDGVGYQYDSPLSSEDEMTVEFQNYLLSNLEISLEYGKGEPGEELLEKMIQDIEVNVDIDYQAPEEPTAQKGIVEGNVTFSATVPSHIPYPDSVWVAMEDAPFLPSEVDGVTIHDRKTEVSPSEGIRLQETMKSVDEGLMNILESSAALSKEQIINQLSAEVSDVLEPESFKKVINELPVLIASEVSNAALKACISTKLDKLYPNVDLTVGVGEPGPDEEDGPVGLKP